MGRPRGCVYTLRPCRRRGATSLSEWVRGGPLGARACSGVSGHRGGIHGCPPALHSDLWGSVLDQLFSHLNVTSDVYLIIGQIGRKGGREIRLLF